MKNTADANKEVEGSCMTNVETFTSIIWLRVRKITTGETLSVYVELTCSTAQGAALSLYNRLAQLSQASHQ